MIVTIPVIPAVLVIATKKVKAAIATLPTGHGPQQPVPSKSPLEWMLHICSSQDPRQDLPNNHANSLAVRGDGLLGPFPTSSTAWPVSRESFDHARDNADVFVPPYPTICRTPDVVACEQAWEVLS